MLENLTNLRDLKLSGNQLSGNIPLNLTSLTMLTGANIGYNALYASDDTLRTFLNDKDPDWEDTQTIAPEHVSIDAFSETV